MCRYKYINRLIRKKEIDYMDDINIITGVIGAVISVITMIAKISNGECLPKKEWILTGSKYVKYDKQLNKNM